MQEMDKDGGGTIDFEEFESWWRANGGDLETKRALAITIVVEGGVQLLLVRPRAFCWLRPAALARSPAPADLSPCAGRQILGREAAVGGGARGGACDQMRSR